MEYDLVVIGGGAGGYVGAIRGAQAGMKVAIVEAGEFGGTCLNRGCIPTKTFLHISEIYKEILQADQLGILAENISFDMQKIYEKKNSIVQKLKDGISLLLKSNKIDVYKGFGKITSKNSVLVSGKSNATLQTKNILIATGATPFMPAIKGINLPNVITSEQLLGDTSIALKELVIVGGGVIGVEIASIYANLGIKVTIIEALEQILANTSRDVSTLMSQSLKAKGVEIHTKASIKEITQADDGLQVIFDGKTGEQKISTIHVLIATGRQPNINSIMSDEIQLETKRGFVVNANFQTNIENIYAIGDCVDGGIQLAHVAAAQATNAVKHMAGEANYLDLSHIPNCIYTNPEIATVGITEKEAKANKLNYKIGKYSMAGNGKSILEGADRGFIKLIFEADSMKLLGAELICGRATDIITTIATALHKGLKANELAHIIYPHPSYSEGILEACESIFGIAVHIPPMGLKR